MLSVRQANHSVQMCLQSQNLEDAWRTWAKQEEQTRFVTLSLSQFLDWPLRLRRIAAGLHILDAEIAGLTFVKPLFKYKESLLPVTSSNELWDAPSASSWKTKIQGEQYLGRSDHDTGFSSVNSILPDQSSSVGRRSSWSNFQVYVKLEALEARILDARQAQVAWCPITRKTFESQLCQLFDQNLRHKPDSAFGDQFCLKILWHSAFMSLLVDFDRLELAIGREGYEECLKHRDYADEWSSSEDARRCAIHGALILRNVQCMPLSQEPAIHISRVLYRAALIWYGYSRFGVDNDNINNRATVSSKQLEFPELTQLNIDSEALLFEANGFQAARPKTTQSSTLCGLVDLLNRIGHWGLSKAFAKQLNFLIGVSDLE